VRHPVRPDLDVVFADARRAVAVVAELEEKLVAHRLLRLAHLEPELRRDVSRPVVGQLDLGHRELPSGAVEPRVRPVLHLAAGTPLAGLRLRDATREEQRQDDQAIHPPPRTSSPS
jgi:hypothetical protein